MAIINIYSKRQRKIRGEVNDVYQYNNIPHALRVQIIKIITDSIGFPSSNERYTISSATSNCSILRMANNTR